MPGLGKYGTVYDALAAKKPLFEKLFPSSPQYNGSLTQAKLLEIAQANLAPPIQSGDSALFPNGVNLDYSGAPKLSDVVVGGEGKPGTPYTPNPASPGEGNGVDPAKLPDVALTPADLKPNVVTGQGGTADPFASSATVGATVLGKALTLGVSPKP
jgi:hypothetical protein